MSSGYTTNPLLMVANRDLTNKTRSMKSKGMGIEWEKVRPPIAKLTCHLVKGRVYNMI